MSETGWDLVGGWIEASRWPVEVVATGDERGAQALERLAISTRSPLGAVVRRSAGLSVDHGWLRILGAGGGEGLRDGVNEWSERAGLLLVAHDAAGGFFSWDEERGVLYHAPDTLAVEDLGGRGYSDWLEAMLTGDLAGFYADARWPGWEEAARALTGDEGFRDREPAPMTELWERFAPAS